MKDSHRIATMFCLILLLGLAVRLFVAYSYPGSTDVKRWLIFARLIEEGELRELYFLRGPLWNHPAPVILFLRLVVRTSELFGWPFHFALKLFPVLADCASIFVIFSLAGRYHRASGALMICASYAFSPAAIIIAAFHGNTDCIMVLFLLVAIHQFEKHPYLSALALGAALSTKYTPLLLFPVFISLVPGFRAMIAYLAVSLAPLLIVSAPFIHAFPGQAAANILSYGSEPGAWGLGHWRAAAEMGLFGEMGRATLLKILDVLLAQSRVLILVLAAGFSLLNWRRRRLDIAQAVAMVMALFFVLTPGFGVQYTVWLLPFFILTDSGRGSGFNLFMSLFVANAFYEGQLNDMAQINPDPHVTIFSLLAWVLVVALVYRLGFRLVVTSGDGMSGGEGKGSVLKAMRMK